MIHNPMVEILGAKEIIVCAGAGGVGKTTTRAGADDDLLRAEDLDHRVVDHSAATCSSITSARS
ncbi:MAG TPA: hypothetical protein VM573_08165, partial [Actinomycetota bacterium]|nr:hypothetical protein [Actinomycetota bacterium]